MGQCLSQQNASTKVSADACAAASLSPERCPPTASIRSVRQNPKRSVSSISNTLQLPIPPSPCPATKHLLIAATPSQSTETPTRRLSEVRMSVSACSAATQPSPQPPASPSRPPPSPKLPPSSPLMARRGSSTGSTDSQAFTSVTPLSPLQSRRVRPPTPKPGDAKTPSALHARRNQRRMRSSSLPEIDANDLRCLQQLQVCVSPSHQSMAGLSVTVQSPSTTMHLEEDEKSGMATISAMDEEPVEPNTASQLSDQSKRDAHTLRTPGRRRSIPNLILRPFEDGKHSANAPPAAPGGLTEAQWENVKSMKQRGRRASEVTVSTNKNFLSPTASMRAVNAKALFGSTVTTPPLASIFDEYVNGAERMKYRHVLHLCHDLVDAFIEGYRQRVEKELREKNGDVSVKNVEAQLATDLPYMLGDGVHKEKTKWVEIAARRMWKLLDFNDEGFVSKTKFMAKFLKSSEDVLNIKQLKKSDNSAADGIAAPNANGPCLVM